MDDRPFMFVEVKILDLLERRKCIKKITSTVGIDIVSAQTLYNITRTKSV